MMPYQAYSSDKKLLNKRALIMNAHGDTCFASRQFQIQNKDGAWSMVAVPVYYDACGVCVGMV